MSYRPTFFGLMVWPDERPNPRCQPAQSARRQPNVAALPATAGQRGCTNVRRPCRHYAGIDWCAAASKSDVYRAFAGSTVDGIPASQPESGGLADWTIRNDGRERFTETTARWRSRRARSLPGRPWRRSSVRSVLPQAAPGRSSHRSPRMQRLDVPHQCRQGAFARGVRQAAQTHAPPAHDLLDDAEHGFRRLFAQRVQRAPRPCAQPMRPAHYRIVGRRRQSPMSTVETLAAASKRTAPTNQGAVIPGAASDDFSCTSIAPARHGQCVSLPHRPRRPAYAVQPRLKGSAALRIRAPLTPRPHPKTSPERPTRNSTEANFFNGLSLAVPPTTPMRRRGCLRPRWRPAAPRNGRPDGPSRRSLHRNRDAAVGREARLQWPKD